MKIAPPAPIEINPVFDGQVIHELAPVSAKLLDKHLRVAKSWYPEEFVPFDNARNFDSDEPWDPTEYPVSEGVQSALLVNLLTEDNLPYYSSTILGDLDRSEPFHEWGRHWTAEEMRHSFTIRSWILATRVLDHRKLEDARMQQVSDGITPQLLTTLDALVYPLFQELATRVAHSNTGRQLDEVHGGKDVMARVAKDEGLHYNYYLGLVKAAIEVFPAETLEAVERQVRTFNMPGTGIQDFDIHARRIADADIYTATKFIRAVVYPTLGKLGVAALEGLPQRGEEARDRLYQHLGRASRLTEFEDQKRQERLARAPV
jgi:acyl-[acyl-carrier-protein] desaturase